MVSLPRENDQVPVTDSGLSSGVTPISAGAGFACIVMNGAAKCWGYGPLGDGTTNSCSVPVAVVGLSAGMTDIAAGSTFACAVVNGGASWWGSNGSGELGNGTSTDSLVPVTVEGLTSGVVSVTASWDHACALLVGGTAKCWGNDTLGQLGDGRYLGISIPQTVVLGGKIFRNGFEGN